MSKDKIGALTRVAVGIKHEYHGIALDVLNRLNGADAAAWASVYAAAHQQSLPTSGMCSGDRPVISAPVGDVELTNNSRLAINYAHPIEYMIAQGRYNLVNPDITAKRFPITGSGVVEVESKLFHFDNEFSSEKAKRFLLSMGYQPAKIEHLLAYGAANPEDQLKFPIIALGSVVGMRYMRRVPILSRFSLYRSLSINTQWSDWTSRCRFLGVRNLAS